MGIYDFTVYDVIQRNAACFSQKTAWYDADDERVLSFGDYRCQVDCLAAGLRRAGLKKGDRIAVLGKNRLEYFLVFGAAAALGAIVLPINWRLSAEEIVFILHDADPSILLVDSEFQPMVQAQINRLSGIRQIFNLEPDDGQMKDFKTLLADGGSFTPAEVATDDGFVIIHTAAVAGRPRGALLSHGNVMAVNLQLNYCFSLTENDVHLNLLPLFHVAGLFMATNSFHAGALNVNMSKFDAVQAADLIARKKVSLIFDFSPILAALLDQQEKNGADLSSLKAVMGIESPEAIERYQAATGGTFYCMYGQTETSCLASMAPYNDRPGSAGRVIPLAGIRLVDDQDQPVPIGQVGEISVKGPMVFKGYWNLPEDNAYTFRNGWHHTGDMGRFDEQGFLWYAGRKPEKELIKPGGENVYPGEVEKVILLHPAVAKTVVFGVPDPKWKEGIKAVCQLKPGAVLATGELIEFVGQRIARYKKPQYVEFVPELPLTADGSIDRNKVKALYGGEQV